MVAVVVDCCAAAVTMCASSVHVVGRPCGATFPGSPGGYTVAKNSLFPAPLPSCRGTRPPSFSASNRGLAWLSWHCPQPIQCSGHVAIFKRLVCWPQLVAILVDATTTMAPHLMLGAAAPLPNHSCARLHRPLSLECNGLYSLFGLLGSRFFSAVLTLHGMSGTFCKLLTAGCISSHGTAERLLPSLADAQHARVGLRGWVVPQQWLANTTAPGVAAGHPTSWSTEPRLMGLLLAAMRQWAHSHAPERRPMRPVRVMEPRLV